MLIRVLAVTALFGAAMYGEDITIPLDDGNIVIRAQFIRSNGYGSDVPELVANIKNQTSSPWRTLKLRFDIGGLCNGEPRQWTLPVDTSLGWSGELPFVREYTDTVISLVGKVDGCKTEIVKVSLILAENSRTRIDGVPGDTVNLERQLRELNAKHEAEATAQAEEKRKATEDQAKKDAIAAKKEVEATARWKRQVAEQKKKDAELDAAMTKQKAEERRRGRTACSGIYQNTVDKKVKDLTVGEEQQVRACQALGLYPPR
jgi:hypothetical protein